jgi:O-methyltransferase
MPATDTELYPVDAKDRIGRWDRIAVGVDEVRANFERYDLLDDQVSFLEGWFKDTLPKAPIGRLAILRLDGDLYSSTTDVLSALYDRVTLGGYVIIDDYALATCRAAVDDFRVSRGIEDALVDIDGTASRWRRSC